MRMRVWQPIVKKISKQWIPNNWMLFGITLLLGIFGIISDTNAASVSATGINNMKPVSSAISKNLKTKLDLFHKKYDATLMNVTMVPFLQNCNDIFNKNSAQMSPTDRLCITYYDMINSIINLNEYKTPESVAQVLHDYNEKSLPDHFCADFPAEIAARLEKQPFAEATNTTNWLNEIECVWSCWFRNETTLKPQILNICKLISGGLSMVVKNSKMETDRKTSKETSTPKNNKNNNSSNNINMKNNEKTETDPTKPENANVPAKTEGKPIENAEKPTEIEEKPTKIEDKPPKTEENPQETVDVDEQIQSTQDENLKNSAAADGEDSEQNTDTKTGNEQRNFDNSGNEDAADEADIKSDDGRHETPQESNSNNNSPLPAKFREDNESSFFSYFMFLMFVIISFYVAYHNKSKILALLIEGRQGRKHSSRGGGSRRKSHSAEYRKLDCNLEEAIQSGGSKTLSTQIIY